MSETITIAGFGPLPVAKPATVAELGRIVTATRARGEAVYPAACRTRTSCSTRPGWPASSITRPAT